MAEGDNDQDDKTEAPSQKRIDDAIKDGNVPKSVELGTWFVFFGLALAIAAMSGSAQNLAQSLAILLAHAHDLAFDAAGLQIMIAHIASSIALAMAWPLVLIVAFAVIGSVIQHQIAVTLKSITPQLSRVSPMSGLGRIYGRQAGINLVKTALKFVIVVATLCIVMWPHRRELPMLLTFEPVGIVRLIHDDLLSVMIAVLIAFGAIAGGDYLVQRMRWYN